MGRRWRLWLLVLIIGWGIAVRSVNLGSHAYWVDEVHTAVRIAGYTKEAITTAQFDNQIHTVSEYNTYQRLTVDRNLSDVLAALAQHPEHPPLYYLLVRWWLQLGQWLGVPQSVAGMRSLSVLFGILLLPAVAALGQELYLAHPQPGAIAPDIALAMVALSPLHILYAQEARAYSLWSVVTVLSCWSLLRAIRCRTAGSWCSYGLIMAVGWYSHLLFVMVAIAHILYVIGLAWFPRQQKMADLASEPRTLLLPMGSAIALSLLTFLPWIYAILLHFSQIQAVVDAIQREPAIRYLLDVWGRNLSRVLVNQDLAGANFLILLAVLCSVFCLWRSRPWRVNGLILALIGVNALPLMAMDLVTGGISSTRIRYLIPAYLGLQWSIAYGLASLQQAKRRWVRSVGRVLLTGLLILGAIAGTMNFAQPTNWAKSDKSAYYPAMAAAINQSPNPLVITDMSATYTLVLAAQLRPEINMLLVNRPNQVKIPDTHNDQPISDVFLVAASPQLQRQLSHQASGELKPVVRQTERFQLLRLSISYRDEAEN
ncbi:MAG: hypothetical protein F6K30_28665 [Cyanothece sp. SIO2G6]|nr:hypothetical protein [Cyanothece sp. SIO2G6]